MRVLMYAALIAITMASVMATHAQPFNDPSLCTASTGVHASSAWRVVRR
jgi:hypothetical protein